MNFASNLDPVNTSSNTNNNNSTEPVTNSWCHTKSTTFKIVYTWTIDDFSFYLDSSNSTDHSAVASSKFCSSSNDKIQFGIYLHPNSLDEASKDYLSILLYSSFEESSATSKLRIRYKFSLIDKAGKMCHTSISKTTKKPTRVVHGWKKFLARSLLLDPNSGLLPDDKLTIHCEVRVFMDCNTISGQYADPKTEIVNKMHENKLSTDLKTLLDKGTHSDVLLVIGSTQYSAHKNILSARSPVFGAMFAHENTEENVLNRVVIIDVSVEAFHELLNYIYSGQVPQKDKLISDDLLIAADNYQVDALKAACEEALSSELDVKTVISLFVLADMHNADRLKIKCIEYITKNATEVMLTKAWAQMFNVRPDLAQEIYRDMAVKMEPIKRQKIQHTLIQYIARKLENSKNINGKVVGSSDLQ